MLIRGKRSVALFEATTQKLSLRQLNHHNHHNRPPSRWPPPNRTATDVKACGRRGHGSEVEESGNGSRSGDIELVSPRPWFRRH